MDGVEKDEYAGGYRVREDLSGGAWVGNGRREIAASRRSCQCYFVSMFDLSIAVSITVI